MLLRINCVRDRKCERCDFESECLVRRILYSKMEIQPRFMTAGDSVGYVLECEDYREQFSAGSTLVFQIILFGKTIVYFGQILDALFRLGSVGLGKNRSMYRIVQVENIRHEQILSGSTINMDRYHIGTIGEYVSDRLHDFDYDLPQCRIVFHTPLALRIQGVNQTSYDIGQILTAIARRLYMLDCCEGVETEQIEITEEEYPGVMDKKEWIEEMPRYSNRKSEKMLLKGIRGELVLDEVTPDILAILITGELIHIGKNTSFGFGRYEIQEEQM